jgi:hypothetical protein
MKLLDDDEEQVGARECDRRKPHTRRDGHLGGMGGRRRAGRASR